jgi:hypothetical protein
MALALTGCVDGFRGSNIELDLFPGTPVQAQLGVAPGMGELPANSHFTLYAIQEDPSADRLFELARFEVHRIVDLSSPCFIDVGAHVPHPGLHVSEYANKIQEDTGISDLANPPASATEQQKLEVATALQRMDNIGKLASNAGIKVVTSACEAVLRDGVVRCTYPQVSTGCTGPSDQIPPSTCTDDASNQLRLELCQAAWNADPALFEGTDRVLTAPLSGVMRGTLVGMNPINSAPVGGAQFFVENALTNVDAYAIYFQVDGADDPGMQLFFGRPTMPSRGVSHVHFTSPLSPLLISEMAVFTDLGQDDVTF